MKSLLKIYGKYIGFTWAVIFVLLAVNTGLFFWVIINQTVKKQPVFPVNNLLGENAEKILWKEPDGQLVMTPEGQGFLEKKDYVFLLVLNDEGDVIYSWNQPEGFENHYTAGEIAAFSRWYLHDYPVKVWRSEEGLLVMGNEKNSRWKYPMELSTDFLYHLDRYVRVILFFNLLIILTVVGMSGYRYYQSLRPLAEGIHQMASGQKVCLDEKGAASELAVEINHTSTILEKQRSALDKRDLARTEWIAGVSHDIRTPLSVIMGYADEFESSGNLSVQERSKAAAIKSQSLKIRQLIEDLNLTSKLEYQMQPLRTTAFYPAALLRNLVAEIINEGLEEQFELNIDLQKDFEGVVINGDKELIARAVRNLLNNSIRHNPGGCRIYLSGSRIRDLCVIGVKDDGCGIPWNVLQCLSTDEKEVSVENSSRRAEGRGLEGGEPGYRESEIREQEIKEQEIREAEPGERNSEKEKPHIMGLRIVKQIVQAHKGGFTITEKGHCVQLTFAIMPHRDT